MQKETEQAINEIRTIDHNSRVMPLMVSSDKDNSYHWLWHLTNVFVAVLELDAYEEYCKRKKEQMGRTGNF